MDVSLELILRAMGFGVAISMAFADVDWSAGEVLKSRPRKQTIFVSRLQMLW